MKWATRAEPDTTKQIAPTYFKQKVITLKKFCALFYKQAIPNRMEFLLTGPEENCCDFLEIIVRINEHRKQTCHCHRPEAFYQILFSIFSIAPAQDNGRLADERLFLIGG